MPTFCWDTPLLLLTCLFDCVPQVNGASISESEVQRLLGMSTVDPYPYHQLVKLSISFRT